jgi:hypothetical protein
MLWLFEQLTSRQARNYAYALFHGVLGLNDNDALEPLVEFEMGSNYISSESRRTSWRMSYQAILYILLSAIICNHYYKYFFRLPLSSRERLLAEW